VVGVQLLLAVRKLDLGACLLSIGLRVRRCSATPGQCVVLNNIIALNRNFKPEIRTRQQNATKATFLYEASKLEITKSGHRNIYYFFALSNMPLKASRCWSLIALSNALHSAIAAAAAFCLGSRRSTVLYEATASSYLGEVGVVGCVCVCVCGPVGVDRWMCSGECGQEGIVWSKEGATQTKKKLFTSNCWFFGETKCKIGAIRTPTVPDELDPCGSVP
jgi:hypothetical protein